MMTLDDLAAYGANTEEGLARCMGNEDFYLRLVGIAQNDKGYDALQAAVQEHNLRAAFEAAHSLKGVLANLAITPLLQPVSEITELLRAETQTDYSELLAKIMEERERFCAL